MSLQVIAPSTSVAPRRNFLRRLRIVHVIALGLVLFALIVPLIAPADALMVNPARRFRPPFGESWLGTDHLGRDLGTLVAVGLRTSLLISFLVVIISGLGGWAIGAVSAYAGGRIDGILGRIMDAFNAFPGLILAIALTTAIGPSLPTLIAVLVLCTWVNYARPIRARTLSLKREEYMVASRLYGASAFHVLGKHVWPNTFDLLMSISLSQIANVMLAESTISFLGFGLQPPDSSLGLVIATQKDYLQINGYPVLLAGIVLVAACTSMAMAALSLRSRS